MMQKKVTATVSEQQDVELCLDKSLRDSVKTPSNEKRSLVRTIIVQSKSSGICQNKCLLTWVIFCVVISLLASSVIAAAVLIVIF
jgi:cytoskeletal protein RodZ